MNLNGVIVLCTIFLMSDFSVLAEDAPPKPSPSKKLLLEAQLKEILGNRLMREDPPAGLMALSKEPREVLTRKLRKAIGAKDLARQAELEYQLGRLIKEKYAGEDFERGLSYLKNASKHFKGLKKPKRRAECLVMLGLLYRKGGQSVLAVPLFEQAIVQFEKMKDTRFSFWARGLAGKACLDSGQIKAALRHFKQSLEASRLVGDQKGEACSLNNVGVVQNLFGAYKKGLESFSESLKLCELQKNELGQARALGNMGISYKALGAYDQALKHYDRCLKLLGHVGTQSNVADVLNNMGEIYNSRGSYHKALALYLRSLKMKEELGERYGAANALNNIGGVHQALGAQEKALACYLRSLKIFEALNNLNGAASTLNNIGALHQRQRAFDKALAYYFRSLKIKEQAGDRNGVANTLGNIGSVYHAQGSSEKALDYYAKSLKVKEQLGDRSGAAATLGNIGHLHQTLGAHDKALANYERSLIIFKQLGARSGIAHVNLFMGLLFRKQRKYDQAQKFLTKSMNLFKAIGALKLQAYASFSLAECLDMSGEAKAALATWEQACKDFPGDVGALAGLALFLVLAKDEAVRDPERALIPARKAVEITKGKHAGSLDVLAEVYHANCRFKEAVETEEKAEKLFPGEYTSTLKRFKKALKLGKRVELKLGDEKGVDSSKKNSDSKNDSTNRDVELTGTGKSATNDSGERKKESDTSKNNHKESAAKNPFGAKPENSEENNPFSK